MTFVITRRKFSFETYCLERRARTRRRAVDSDDKNAIQIVLIKQMTCFMLQKLCHCWKLQHSTVFCWNSPLSSWGFDSGKLNYNESYKKYNRVLVTNGSGKCNLSFIFERNFQISLRDIQLASSAKNLHQHFAFNAYLKLLFTLCNWVLNSFIWSICSSTYLIKTNFPWKLIWLIFRNCWKSFLI